MAALHQIPVDPRRVLFERVLTRACEALMIDPEYAMSRTTKLDAVTARHVVAYVLVEIHGMTGVDASRFLGRDHSTVHSSRILIARRMRTDRRIREIVEYASVPPEMPAEEIADAFRYLRAVDRLAGQVREMARGAAEAMSLLGRLASDVQRLSHTAEAQIAARARLTAREMSELYPDLLSDVEEAAG